MFLSIFLLISHRLSLKTKSLKYFYSLNRNLLFLKNAVDRKCRQTTMNINSLPQALFLSLFLLCVGSGIIFHLCSVD